MINPYEILEVDQDAPMHEILKAMQQAMVKRKHPIQVLNMARTQISTPDKRLAADFTFPVFDDVGTLLPFPVPEIDSIDISSFNVDKYDSM